MELFFAAALGLAAAIIVGVPAVKAVRWFAKASCHLKREEEMAKRIIMSENYRGVVVDEQDDHVVVRYDVDDSVVEQTYERKQFIGQQLPAVDTHVRVRVTLVETLPPPPPDFSEIDESPESRRIPLAGPDQL
jgi:hypothetical protein